MLLPRIYYHVVMIPVVAIVTIVASVATAAEPDPAVFHKNPAAAWQLAQQRNRPVVIFITTDACVHCKKMQQHTFRDPKVKSDLQRNFIATVVKPTDGLPIVDRLGVRSYPTTAVIAPSGHVLAQIRGFVSAADFRVQLERTLRGVRTAARP